MHPFHHHKLLHIMSVIRLKAFWYFYLRCLSAYNYIMCKGIKPSSHCLHLPNLPTPPTFQAVASHSLLVPRNFMPFTALTAANKPRSSAYQLLSPTALSGWTSIQAGEFFVYKSVLQVTSGNLRIHHTCYVAASNCPLPPLTSSLFRHLSVWQVRTSRSPALTHSIVTVTVKYTPKAKPRSSAQLLLCAVGRNRAK